MHHDPTGGIIQILNLCWWLMYDDNKYFHRHLQFWASCCWWLMYHDKFFKHASGHWVYMQSWASSDNWWLVICMKIPRAAKYKRNILHPMIDDNPHHRAFFMANFCHWQYLFGRKFWTNLFYFPPVHNFN